MNHRLQDVLQGKQDNYLLPFFWQHGASEETLREYMDVIHRSGIGAVCVEARPHPDFVGDRWWHDVDIVMEEARKRHMRVWVLDDSHFPTGFANGAAINAPDNLKRWSLVERQVMVDGPTPGCKFEVASHLGHSFIDKGTFTLTPFCKEELVAVIAGKRMETDDPAKPIFTDFVDLTEKVNADGWFYHDFPDGPHSLFIYTKKQGAAADHNDYISFLEKDSVRLLLDTVYEPHYRHYREDFGKTFAGFFSDEPGFYNLSNIVYGAGQIGDNMPLPWTDDVCCQIRERMGSLCVLPGLYHELGGSERTVRHAYMDIITQKYQENFSDQIGTWCEDHGVEYIGHVLEDGIMNRSLGAGTGHYFRALHGQHMGGVDAVINDLLPNRDYGNGFFYHYELPVLASSIAHQNSWMKGRAMCELFGAYGWSEGLTLMKWLADHMLVHGINHFVPHAFSELPFPDPDNPPHFYLGGLDSQFRYMDRLFHYMNRVSHLFSGGRAMVDNAVFFPAEGDWMGSAATFGRLGSRFLQNQIPYETICLDTLKDATVRDGKICIGQAAYENLFIDRIKYLPKDALDVFRDLAVQGAKLWFVDCAPVDAQGDTVTEIPVISDGEVLDLVEDSRFCKVSQFSKWLRCYPYQQDDVMAYLFVNSSMAEEIDVTITLPVAENEVMVGYDALNDHLFAPDRNEDDIVYLCLDKGESCILMVGSPEVLPKVEPVCKATAWRELDNFWQVSVADYTAQETFTSLDVLNEFEDIALKKPGFGGIVRYETTFTGKHRYLSLGRCYDGVEVFVNGKSAGVRIANPYVYDIDGLTEEGENHLRIETGTTLTNVAVDGFSMDRPVTPQGIFGPVRLA